MKVMAGSGVCYCGASMVDHPEWDNHAPKQMLIELELDEFIREILDTHEGWGFSIDETTDR